MDDHAGEKFWFKPRGLRRHNHRIVCNIDNSLSGHRLHNECS